MKSARRADIDTLRAISVISVIIFHLDQSYFPNGYLGVDIFFVISGYVIAKSILRDLKRKKFKFSEFYFKRLKRILPVFLIVLFSTLIFAIFIYLIADLNRFLESLISSLGFVSNFYFWATGGYFSTNDQLKPLLHIWSLSVEEQFYLFFPLFLYLLFKINKKINYHLLILILIILSSFILNLFFISKGHRDIIFFMFPARIWQFGLGVLFAMMPILKIKNLWFETFYFLIAFILIIFNFCKKIDFLPDATFISLGVSLILYKNIDKNNYLSNLFKIKPLIFLGLISFSLYLWHWPIISFLKYIIISEFSYLVIISTLSLIFLLSCLTWRYVESPFLYDYPKKKILYFIITSYVVLIISAVSILKIKEFPSRYGKFPNDLAKSIGSTYNCSLSEFIKFGDTYACLLNSKSIDETKDVLFGNSHAYMYGWAFKEYLKNSKQKGLIVQMSNCLPFIDKNISEQCLKKSKSYYNEIINDKSIENVILGLTWFSNKLVDEKGNKFVDTNFELRKKSISLLVKNFKDKNKTVYLLGPIEIPKKEFSPEVLSREIIFKDKKKLKLKKPRDNFETKYRDIIDHLDFVLKDNFLKPHKILCDVNSCYFADKNGSFFSDFNHLSKYGSLKMIKIFEKLK